jgi:hypothetical protein
MGAVRGHGEAMMRLDVYSHVLPDMQQEASDTEDTPLSGPVEGTICIKRKLSKVERRYRCDGSLINGDSAWSVVFGCDLPSGTFGNAK